jgi:copper resistance protein D
MSAEGPTQAEILSWRRESEGNHHLVGFFVALAGAFILAQDTLKKRFPAVSYAWSVSFLISGLFVLVYSDTELWPFGPKPWIQGTITNPEVIQHKIFAVLLLGLGLVEMQRARERLKAAWAALGFSGARGGGFRFVALPFSQCRDAGRKPHGDHGAYSG